MHTSKVNAGSLEMGDVIAIQGFHYRLTTHPEIRMGLAVLRLVDPFGNLLEPVRVTRNLPMDRVVGARAGGHR